MKKIFILVFFINTFFSLWSQTPTNQDCLGAIPVCQDAYDQPNSYVGTGNYHNEIPIGGGCPGNCLENGERNDVWYIFTVQTSGLLSFTLTPYNNSDDYDWAVYSLNDFKCQDIINHATEMQVSCNYSSTVGATGPNGNDTVNCQGGDGSQFNAKIPVNEGDTYVVNISNFTSTQYGYLLDFSESTAVISDNVAPSLSKVEAEGLICGINNFTFKFSEKVLCNSVQASDFILSGPGGPYMINEIYGGACSMGAETENIFTISFDPPIVQNGEYMLSMLSNNLIQDACGNTADSLSFSFFLNLNFPVSDAGPEQFIANGTFTTLLGSASVGQEPYEYFWGPVEMINGPSDIPNPQTVVLTQSQVYSLVVTDNNGCQSDASIVLINVSGSALSCIANANPSKICEGESTVLSANATGGSGNYIYYWTNNLDPLWNSAEEAPTVTPSANVVYFLEVNDGNSTYNSQAVVQVNERPQINLIPSGYEEGPPNTITACVFDTITLDAGNDANPPNMEYLWSNTLANRYMLAQTNGNWWDMRTYSVVVKNPITGCSNTSEIHVIFDFNSCAIGVEENIGITASPVTIHPNPNQGSFTVRPDEDISHLTLQLMSMQGAAIFEKSYTGLSAGSQDINFDISNLSNGVYLLRVLANEHVYFQKIVKN